MANYMISVPLRGLWFLIIHFHGFFSWLTSFRFRPLTGIMIFKTQNHPMTKIFTRFRPLTGIMILNNLRKSHSNPRKSFRPLTGIMILNADSKEVQTLGNIGSVSVPLRGLWFLILRDRHRHLYVWLGVSVPLRGLWFLITLLISLFVSMSFGVSVPLRGLWFLIGARTIRFALLFFVSFRPLTGIVIFNQKPHLLLMRLAMKEFPSPYGDYDF